MPDNSEDGIIKGLYKLQTAQSKCSVRLLGSGTILRESIAAAELLQQDFGIAADVWSATSLNELARDGRACERYNRLHPTDERKISWVEQCFSDSDVPVIAATDYKQNFAEQIRAFVPAAYSVLGTDGYGRSDSRENLRRFFEVDRYHIVVTALKSLSDEGDIPVEKVTEAIAKYNIYTDAPNPAFI
jgi:pyruvate dehydrogenase E1 component